MYSSNKPFRALSCNSCSRRRASLHFWCRRDSACVSRAPSAKSCSQAKHLQRPVVWRTNPSSSPRRTSRWMALSQSEMPPGRLPLPALVLPPLPLLLASPSTAPALGARCPAPPKPRGMPGASTKSSGYLRNASLRRLSCNRNFCSRSAGVKDFSTTPRICSISPPPDGARVVLGGARWAANLRATSSSPSGAAMPACAQHATAAKTKGETTPGSA
mmetsp:Transcript_17486/g.48074  ORF Transcript_17486/g.48074 Transcript_17486/m.48074 type:complete len:216 (+) Transcript_17486:643-1290(+)